MKRIKSFFLMIIMFLNFLPYRVFAEAYLEGDEQLEDSGFFDGIDSNALMANWYKIVLVVVAVLCIIGLIACNISWYKKNKRNKK